MKNISHRTAGIAAALTLGLAATAPAYAVSVTVNGQQAQLNPPPIERAGRVFVPLRGVFQQLGAAVVYGGGVINATGNNRTISLKIGSNQATVNGQPTTIDTPPFIIGASTYVPLRFVSEALGAGVNFDGANQIVALTTSGAVASTSNASGNGNNGAGNNGNNGNNNNGNNYNGNNNNGSNGNGGNGNNGNQPLRNLRDFEPGRGGSVDSTRPTISANFQQPVDPNSVAIALDGRTVTNDATLSTTGFVYAPGSPLQSIQHQVRVAGKTASGQPFEDRWSFSSGTATQQNDLRITSPSDGASVPSNFTVTGRTAPNAQVHIVAGATTSVGGIFQFGSGNYTGDTTADGNGDFSQAVSLQSVGGNSQIGLTVTSTDPRTRSAAEKKLRLQGQ